MIPQSGSLVPKGQQVSARGFNPGDLPSQRVALKGRQIQKD